MLFKKINRMVMLAVSFVMFLGLLTPVGQMNKATATEAERTKINITELTILKKQTGEPTTWVTWDETFTLQMKWKATFYGNTLKKAIILM